MTDPARGRPSAGRDRARGSTETEPHDDRARGRELALLALCHLESYPVAEHESALQLLWRSPPRGDDERGSLLVTLVRDEPTRRRATALLQELWAHRAELDASITETSVRWRLERMAQVDRNVLRLAAFELAFRPRTPRPVVLSEAVRLARRYGSERSVGFVNGVAEALAQRLRVAPAEHDPREEEDG
ncbi:MAG: transcription antitermination factor NusB [Bacteroidales bacterium]